MCPLNIEMQRPAHTETKMKFTVRGWVWVGLINGVEVTYGSYVAVSNVLREIVSSQRSAADIPREQEAPPKKSKRFIFWSASKTETV